MSSKVKLVAWILLQDNASNLQAFTNHLSKCLIFLMRCQTPTATAGRMRENEKMGLLTTWWRLMEEPVTVKSFPRPSVAGLLGCSGGQDKVGRRQFLSCMGIEPTKQTARCSTRGMKWSARYAATTWRKCRGRTRHCTH